MAATGVSTTYYPCESCGQAQAVSIAHREDAAPISLNRRPCGKCGGTLSSWPVGLLDKMERIVQEERP